MFKLQVFRFQSVQGSGLKLNLKEKSYGATQCSSYKYYIQLEANSEALSS